MDLKELKLLHAKTTGSKAVSERRLYIWQTHGLNRLLAIPTTLEVPSVNFPEASNFKPLVAFTGKKFMNAAAIDKWFDATKSQKGKENGRILALKSFIKYCQVYLKDNLWYVTATCCAEQKRGGEYKIRMVVQKHDHTIKNSNCSCPAGTGWSASCKHIGALCYFLEYFTLRGKTLESVSCTTQPNTWNPPPSGTGVDYMSIFDINRTVAKSHTVDENFTANTINKLINYKIDCSLVKIRQVCNSSYIHDHGYYSLSQVQQDTRF